MLIIILKIINSHNAEFQVTSFLYIHHNAIFNFGYVLDLCIYEKSVTNSKQIFIHFF